MKNIFYGYARVSTVGQNDTSIEVQLEYLRLQAESLSMPFEGYFEKKSGKNLTDRGVLQSLIEKSIDGDVVAVYDNSRLGRNTEENLSIIKTLHAKGVDVRINNKTIDPNNPEDELSFSIQSSISTFQRKTQLSKSRAGINIKKKNGDWVMRGDLLGYRISKSGKTTTAVIVEKEANIIKWVFNRYAQGDSIRKITSELNDKVEMRPVGDKFYEASIRRIIFKPIYMGYYFKENQKQKNLPKMTRQEVEIQLVKSNVYPPIINEQLWWDVFTSYRKINRKHTKQYDYRFSYYELSSVIRCGECGASYVHSFHKTKQKVYEYYSCLIHNKNCKPINYNLPLSRYELIMQSTLYMTYSDPFELTNFFDEKKALLDASSATLRENILLLQQRENEIHKRKQNLIQAIEDGIISLGDIKNRIRNLDSELTDIHERIQSIEYNLNEDDEELSLLLDECRVEEAQTFYNSDATKRRKKYLALITSAKLYKGKLIVRYSNGKTFVIKINPPRGRFSQKVFKIKVAFNGRIQFEYTINIDDRKLYLIRKKSVIDDFEKYYDREVIKKLDFVESMLT